MSHFKESSPAVSASLRLLCLLHNLMVLFEAGLAETGITNTAEEKRRKKVLTERTERVEEPDAGCASFMRASRGEGAREVAGLEGREQIFWCLETSRI